MHFGRQLFQEELQTIGGRKQRVDDFREQGNTVDLILEQLIIVFSRRSNVWLSIIAAQDDESVWNPAPAPAERGTSDDSAVHVQSDCLVEDVSLEHAQGPRRRSPISHLFNIK